LKSSISRTIIVTVAITTILAMTVVIVINTMTTYRLTIDLSSVTLSNQNEDISRVIDGWHDSIYYELQELSNDILFNVSQTDQGIQRRVDRSFSMSKQNVYLLNLYYGSASGRYISATEGILENTLLPKDRVWYRIASETPGEMAITPPYLDAHTQKMCITFAHTVGYGKSIHGVVGMDFVMESLDRYMSQVTKGAGNVIIFNSNGNIIFHPNADKFLNTGSGADGVDEKYRELWNTARTSAGQLFRLKVDGEDMFYSARKLASGWYIVNYDSASNVLKPLYAAVASFILIAVAGVLTAVIVIYLVIRAIVFNPLKILIAATREFDAEDNATFADVEIKVENELKTLADTLGEMEKRTIMANKRAYTDYMTGLYTREFFYNKVSSDLSRQRHGPLYGFFVIDLDKFKSVNDTFGHSVGDAVITGCGKKLKEIFTEHGSIVARIGGDEFAAFMGIVNDENEIREKCVRIKEEFSKVTYGNNDRGMTASVGAIAVEGNVAYSEVFEAADRALYTIKERGRDGAEIVVIP
jgi:diguanylate cyclase (GGDEF)-like protein